MKLASVFLLMALISLAFLSDTAAQSRDGKGSKSGIWEALDLSEDQQQQLKELHSRMRDSKEQFKERGERPTKEEIEALNSEYKEGLAAILNSDQLAKFEEMKAEGRGHGPRRRGGSKGGPMMHALKKLDLSDEQWASIKELHQARRAEMEQYKASGQRPTREEMQARHQAMRVSIEAILTPEQLSLLGEMKASSRGRGENGGHRRHRGRGFGLKGLDLSEDQKEQLRALWKGMAEERKARRASGVRPSREEMRALREAMRGAIADILTPEQRQQLEERRAARIEGRERGTIGTTENALTTSDVPATAIQSTSWGRIKAGLR